jgi:hypothetical protein
MLTCEYCVNLKKCIKDANDNGFEHNEHFDGEEFCPNYGFKRNTNADRIRAMSDEELADFISTCGCPDHARDCRDSCKDCTLEWLKQPAEE